MFEIRVLPPSQLGPDGQRLGTITIGNFTETFPCYCGEGSISEMESRWIDELRKLLADKSAVALIHDPRFAWIMYREDNSCYVQQRLATNGEFFPIAPRRTHNEDGDRISEWTTYVVEIERFLRSSRDHSPIG
jgi:hypothetical protein